MRPLAFCLALVLCILGFDTATAATRPIPRRTLADTVKLGSYDLEIGTSDGTLTGELKVKRDSTGLVATIRAGGMSPAVKSFVKDGANYVLTGGHGDFTVVYTLTFARDSLHGSYKLSNGTGGDVIGALHK